MPHVEIPQAEFKVSKQMLLVYSMRKNECISYEPFFCNNDKSLITNNFKHFKVVILGDSNIGKTSLVTRFAEGYYRENSRPATVGAFFVTKRISHSNTSTSTTTTNNTNTNNIPTTKIHIWDTAGSSSFHAMAPMFYKNAAAIIVCYDVTSRQSFDGMRLWLDEVRRKVKVGEDVVVAIAALKTDLLQNHQHGQQQEEPAVPEYEVEQLAEALNVIYLPTSAKTNLNVTNLFHCVADRVLQYRTGGGNDDNSMLLLNRDDLNSSSRVKVTTSPRRVRDQYDKYYVKENSESENNTTNDGMPFSSPPTATTDQQSTKNNSQGKKFFPNENNNNRTGTPSTDGTSSSVDHGSDLLCKPQQNVTNKKNDMKNKKNSSKTKEVDDSSYSYACNPVGACGVGTDGSSGCIVQ